MLQGTALITGASSGIGRELARVFAANGHDVILVARRQARLESLADELRAAHGVRATCIPADLTEINAAERLQQQLEQAGLSVEVLVNNAGFGRVGKFAELPGDQQLEMIRLNVLTLVDLTHRFLPQMLARRRGAILNVASTAAFQPGPNLAVYFATKAYVLSFSEAIAYELRRSNVRVTCLCPGPTRTEFEQQANASRLLLFQLGPMKASAVAKHGYHGLQRGKTLVVPGLGNWLTAFFIRLLPRSLVCRLAAMLTQPPAK